MTIETQVFIKLTKQDIHAKAESLKKPVRKTKQATKNLVDELTHEDGRIYRPSEVYIVVEDTEVKYLKVLISLVNPSVRIIRDIEEEFIDVYPNLYPFQEGFDKITESLFEAAIGEGVKPEKIDRDELYPETLINALKESPSIFELAGKRRYIVRLEVCNSIDQITNDIILGKDGSMRGFQAHKLRRKIEEVTVVTDGIVIVSEPDGSKSLGNISFDQVFKTTEEAYEFASKNTTELKLTGQIVLENDENENSSYLDEDIPNNGVLMFSIEGNIKEGAKINE